MPRIPEGPSSAHRRWLADLLLNELQGLRSGNKPYEMWWVQPRLLDTSLDFAGRGRFSTLWPDMMGQVPLSDVLQRILTLGGRVAVICEPFSQAFTRSNVLAGPEALVNRLRLAFPAAFQAYTVPRVAPEQSAWIGEWGAVIGPALAVPEATGVGCRYIADPAELARLRTKCRALADGRATAFPELARPRITTGELDMMRTVIRSGGRYVDVERLP